MQVVEQDERDGAAADHVPLPAADQGEHHGGGAPHHAGAGQDPRRRRGRRHARPPGPVLTRLQPEYLQRMLSSYQLSV